MGHKMNVFTPEFLTELKNAFHFIEESTSGPACLVTTSSLAKVFSAGLNLKVMQKPDAAKEMNRMYRGFVELIL